jgi:hypothetical protein
MASLLLRRTPHLQHKFLVVKGTYVLAGAGLRRHARGRPRKLFCDLAPFRRGQRRRQTKNKTQQSQNGEVQKVPIVIDRNCCKQISSRLRFNELPCSSSPIGDKATKLVRASPFAASRCTGTRCTATNNLLHLNSVPNEATTSIWLKAMMVRRDLRGNTEPFENEH